MADVCEKTFSDEITFVPAYTAGKEDKMSEALNRRDAIVEDVCHFFFLIDQSESMIGDPIQAVNDTMGTMVPTLLEAAETKEVIIMVHVLAYNDTVHWLCGSTAEHGVPIEQFQWHEISAGGGKNTAGAIRAVLPGLSWRYLSYRSCDPIFILITNGKNDSFEDIRCAAKDLDVWMSMEKGIIGHGDPDYDLFYKIRTIRMAFGVKEYNVQNLAAFASTRWIYSLGEFDDMHYGELVFPLDEGVKRLAHSIRNSNLLS